MAPVLFEAHGDRVAVRIQPEGKDGSVTVHAPGHAIDAVYACSFGGFRPYAMGRPLFPGRKACGSVDIAIQSALEG